MHMQALRRTDPFLFKTVKIAQGPWKGYIGIVKVRR
jgi:transcription elongation factor